MFARHGMPPPAGARRPACAGRATPFAPMPRRFPEAAAPRAPDRLKSAGEAGSPAVSRAPPRRRSGR